MDDSSFFSSETPSWSQRFDLTRAPSFLLPHGSLFTTLNMCLLHACLHTFFASFFSLLNRAQSLSLPVSLALLYARFLLLTALLVFVLNQGCPRRVELNLDGTCSDSTFSSSCCRSSASCSTGVSKEFWTVNLLDHFMTLSLMVSQSAFFQREILWWIGLRLCAWMLTSVKTKSWSLRAGRPPDSHGWSVGKYNIQGPVPTSRKINKLF